MNWISSFILITSLATIAVSKPQGPAPCKDGDTWMDDCNHCHCSNGLAACTQMACIPNPNSQRQVRSPQVSGAACKDGDRWNDGCNECRCKNGIAFCTRKICPAEGEYLRPVRSTGFIFTLPCSPGAYWLEDCSYCFCHYSGRTVCTSSSCLFHPLTFRECDCDPFGSLRPICDEQGQCVCRPHYSGLKCDRCAPDYHQGPDGCQEECVPLTAWKKGHVVCTCSESGVETCEHELNRQRRETQTSLPSVSDVLADQVKRNLDCAEGTVWKTNCADCSCKDHGPFCKGIPGCKPGPINTPKTSCEEGERWKDECNDCWCEQNRAVCTRKGCEGYPHYQIQLPEGASEQQHVATKREVKKETCKEGETWQDDCNDCWCDNGRPACTLMGCEQIPQHTATKRDTAQQTCKEGERWKEDCNDCWCDNNLKVCTRKGCEQSHQHTVTRRDAAQQSCTPGKVWIQMTDNDEGCAKFTCQADGSVTSVPHFTREMCPSHPEYIEDDDDQQQQQQQQQQQHVTKREAGCKPGDTWMNDCNQCTCNDEGKASCSRMQCEKDHPEEIPWLLEQEQQQQQQVTKRETSCTPGKVWIQMTDNDEGCAKFTCQADGSVTSVPHFTREMCPSHPEYIEDNDDQQQQQQQQQQQHVTKREAGCKPGDTWMNDCNQCTCNDEGKASCSRMQCEKDHPEEIPWLLEQEQQQQQQQQVTKRETTAGCTPGKVWIQIKDNDEGCAKFTCQADGSITSVPHFTREMCPHPEYIEDDDDQHQQQQQQHQQHVSKREAVDHERSLRIRRVPPPEGCLPGQSYFDGCNNCICSASGPPSCTFKICPPQAQVTSVNFSQLPPQSQQNVQQ